jgi:hypothetical protein
MTAEPMTTEPMTAEPSPRAVRRRSRAAHHDEVHHLRAEDGARLSLIRVRGEREPTLGPVLLAAGSGVRAELFRPPVETTLVDALVDAGFEPWLFNWRGSIDFDPIPWTLDDVAAYDHPAAVRHIVAETGAATIKAVVHCQGSTAFSMSAVAGLVPEVDVIVSNAVSLHPVVPAFSRVKMDTLRPLSQRVTPYLDPSWGDGPTTWFSHVARAAVLATHWECDNPVCRMVSFTYGSGRPALWRHENLDEATHDWIRGEFGEVPMSFFAQMAQCIRAGQLVSVSTRPGLLERYADGPPRTDARIVLLAGRENRCFLPESQQRTFDHLERHRPGRQSLHLMAGYSHLDPFLGKNAARDVFPTIVDALVAGPGTAPVPVTGA